MRLAARVEYDDGHAPDELWYDLPSAWAGHLSASGHVHAAALMLLAMKLREPLRIDRPLDAVFRRNLIEQSLIWRCWFPSLGPLRIDADTLPPSNETPATRTAAFFSGGVDSFFTLLRRDDPGTDPGDTIDDLIYVWGFDLAIDQHEEFAEISGHLRTIAAAVKKDLLFACTNLRRTRAGRSLDWRQVHHGCGLASAAHLLEGRWLRVLISATHTYHVLGPLGSHPLIDPLFSSGSIAVVHDGAAWKRTEKTERVAGSPECRRFLRVCWKTGRGNCCRCEKCYRTMATLDALGCLDQFESFDQKLYDRTKLGRIYAPTPGTRNYLVEIAELAESRGRPEIADAMHRSLCRSERTARLRKAIEFVRMSRFGGFAPMLKHWMTGGAVE